LTGELRVVRRHPLSKREVRELLAEASALGEPPFTRKSSVELVEVEVGGRKYEVYLVDGVACLARIEGRLIPTIQCLTAHGSEWMKGRILVDKGATLALARGAHLMIPGIRGVEGYFKKGDVVAVLYDETRAPVMIGVAEEDSEEIARAAEEKRRGRAVKRLHHVGDNLWKAAASLK